MACPSLCLFLTPSDWQALWLTLQVAGLTTVVLLLLGTPLAWWLAQTDSWCARAAAAVVAVPLVLPPTVLGFYLLVAMGPHGFIGQWTQALGWGLWPFSLTGLVLGSVVYSLPFMVQPLQTAMQAIGPRPLEVAATLRASRLDTFWHVVLPLCRPGIITGTVMTFAHTLGEFGVVLMVGGNIPGVTRVVSVQIYDYVEAADYAQAHRLAALMLVLAVGILVALYSYNARAQRRNHV
jgi:molybdate transport system permease protein